MIVTKYIMSNQNVCKKQDIKIFTSKIRNENCDTQLYNVISYFMKKR